MMLEEQGCIFGTPTLESVFMKKFPVSQNMSSQWAVNKICYIIILFWHLTLANKGNGF